VFYLFRVEVRKVRTEEAAAPHPEEWEEVEEGEVEEVGVPHPQEDLEDVRIAASCCVHV